MRAAGHHVMQVKTAAELLKHCGLLQYQTPFVDYGKLDVPTLRRLSYPASWRLCLSNWWFDLVLNDGSLFQFRYAEQIGGPLPAFSFMHAPYHILPYDKFLEEVMDTSFHAVGDSHWSDYEQYVDMTDERPHPLPFRYDYDPGAYRPGRHPASHIHVGLDNSVRFGADRILLPVSFTLLVLRQLYPDAWENIVLHPKWKVLRRNVRDVLDVVPKSLFADRDKDELTFR